jgi:hypothetical protein
VPDTEKSLATKVARLSVDVSSKFSDALLLGVCGDARLTVGGPRSISKEVEEKALVGPGLDCESTTLFARKVMISVPSPQPEAVTVKVVPLAPLTPIEQFGAFPEFKKSSGESPETLDAKLRVYEIVPVVDVGELVVVEKELTVGAKVSKVTVKVWAA